MAKKQRAKGSGTSGTLLTKNRRALFNYHVLERFEAGISLLGSEVKSIRDGKVSLAEAYAQFAGSELYLAGAHVAEYVQAHARNHDPMRKRKLLLHRRELDRLKEAVSHEGLTLVPLALYLKEGRVKVDLGLCRGKQVHDKRASLKEKEQKREVDRALRER